jgi:hypothetical protein
MLRILKLQTLDPHQSGMLEVFLISTASGICPIGTQKSDDLIPFQME